MTTPPTTSTIVLVNTDKRLVIKCLALFVDADESNVVKVDKSTYTGPNGLEPSYFLLERIEASVGDTLEVAISVDHTTDIVLARLQRGSHTTDYTDCGKHPGLSTAGTGDTGDILFTTAGGTSATTNDSYDITLYLKKID